MNSKCLLETEGYQILFDLKTLDSTTKDVDAVVEFILDPRLAEISVKSVPTFVAIKDLQRLIKYFEEHIALLQQDSDSESYTFVTWGLGFQVQALSGEVRSPNDGEFTLRFTINVGYVNKEASRIYVGGESVVTLENIHRFTSSVYTTLTELGFREPDSGRVESAKALNAQLL